MIAILGDMHGDLAMFKRALKQFPETVDQIVVLGDVIGSTNDAEIIELLHHLNATLLLGHCEAEALGLIRTPENVSPSGSQDEHSMSPRTQQLIQSWRMQATIRGATFVHGSMRHPLKSAPLSQEEGMVEKSYLQSPIVFRGHLHQPSLDAINDDKVIHAPWTWDAEILLVGAEHWIITIPACSHQVRTPGFVLWDPDQQRMWFVSLDEKDVSLGEKNETR